MPRLIMNGIDYPKRSKVLDARGIAPFGTDDAAFGEDVYCNQHQRIHSTGWCTVPNIEKFGLDEKWPVAPSPDRSQP